MCQWHMFGPASGRRPNGRFHGIVSVFMPIGATSSGFPSNATETVACLTQYQIRSKYLAASIRRQLLFQFTYAADIVPVGL
ncbi:MAG: hypothetical protein ACLVLH_17095 [Eisenbergiella massiliensis]